MNWDQIEIKWAEMTSRVRADVPLPRPKAAPVADTPAVRIGLSPDKISPVTNR